MAAMSALWAACNFSFGVRSWNFSDRRRIDLYASGTSRVAAKIGDAGEVAQRPESARATQELQAPAERAESVPRAQRQRPAQRARRGRAARAELALPDPAVREEWALRAERLPQARPAPAGLVASAAGVGGAYCVFTPVHIFNRLSRVRRIFSAPPTPVFCSNFPRKTCPR